MGEKVIVVLDRGTADYLRLLGNDHHSPEFFSDCYQGEVMPAVEAALGRDREEEVSPRALAEMYAEVRRRPREGTVSDALRCHSQACGLVAYAFDVHPDTVARAVSAAAIERADQGGG